MRPFWENKVRSTRYPICLGRGDTLIEPFHFMAGENLTFNDAVEIANFIQNSKEVEWAVTEYPRLFGLFGGQVERKTYKGRVWKQ